MSLYDSKTFDRYFRGGVGRNDFPSILGSIAHLLTDKEIGGIISGCWCAPEYPVQHLGKREWIRLFKHAGFVDGDGPADRPADPVRLWRGCINVGAYGAAGMSWTADRDKAQWFADRCTWQSLGLFGVQVSGDVLEAVVQPEALLAQISSRSESEYVINPYMRSKIAHVSTELAA
jgi:hypothetical protein